MKKRILTQILTATIITAIILTGCATKAPTVTTETVDVTTYTVIDEGTPTITETSKNEDGTTTIITKTTDGTIVSIATTTTEATTQETEKETTATSKETTATPTAAPTETVKPTTPAPTETTPEPTATTKPEPTETAKPTDTPKPTETTKPTIQPTTKPSEPTKEPTTKPSEPTTKPTEPTTKPTTPAPTTPEPTTPEPEVKYEVVVDGYNIAGAGTTTGTGTYKAGTKVTLKFVANDGYEFNKAEILHGNDYVETTNSTYTFTINGDVYINVYFKKVQAPTQPAEPDYRTGTVKITYTIAGEANGITHTKEFYNVPVCCFSGPNSDPRAYKVIESAKYDEILAFLTSEGCASYNATCIALD